jgi:seryl-tRNA synthetase
MLDIRFVREHATEVQTNAKNKGYNVNVDELLIWDSSKRELQKQSDELRERRNEMSLLSKEKNFAKNLQR